MIDIRGQNRNIQLLAFGNVSGNFSGAVQNGRHKRRHILPRIIVLQIRRLIGHYRIAHRMRLVKRVISKVDNFVINGLGDFLSNSLRNCSGNSLLFVAVNEDMPLRLNDFLLLFGNGAPDVVRLSHGIPGQTAEYLNHLFLVDNATVCDTENRLQKRRFIGNLLCVQFVGNKPGDGIHGTRAV